MYAGTVTHAHALRIIPTQPTHVIEIDRLFFSGKPQESGIRNKLGIPENVAVFGARVNRGRNWSIYLNGIFMNVPSGSFDVHFGQRTPKRNEVSG